MPSFSKKASCPTKMGEIMNLGVPVICNKGVGDVEEIMNITIIGTGETVQRAFLASRILKEDGVNAEVISMHTIKPFDEYALMKSIKKTNCLISVEEHSIYGGLGECCASLISQAGYNTKFKSSLIKQELTNIFEMNNTDIF